MFIIYLVKFSFLFFLFATDCVFSVNKDYHKNDAKFRILDPVKIRGGVGEISIFVVAALPTIETTECINLMAIHCTAVGSAALIKKSKETEENT